MSCTRGCRGAAAAAAAAEDVVVQHRGQRQPVKHLVAPLPHLAPVLVAEALLALGQEALLAVVLLPAVRGPGLVVAPQQEHLVRVQQLQGQQPGHALQAGLAPVHVVAQEQEGARRQRHAQRPQRLREEREVLDVPVDVPDHVNWGGQK